MKRRYLQIILAAVLFLLALGLTLYPVVSNYYNQRHQSQIQTAYREVLEQTDTAELKRIREQAAAYNAAITPGAHRRHQGYPAEVRRRPVHPDESQL